MPDELRSQLNETFVVGPAGGSYGTQEFHEWRAQLVRLLVGVFDTRAVAFEAPFHQFRRIDERIAAGEDGARSILTQMDGYRPLRTEPIADLLAWLGSYNADRQPADRVCVYEFDTTIIADAAVGIGSYLDRAGVGPDSSLRTDLEALTEGTIPRRNEWHCSTAHGGFTRR